jgi:PAS domain S-box-containing protein
VNDVFWISNRDFTKLLYVSPAYETIWGRSCRSFYEDAPAFFYAIHPDDRPRVDRAAIQKCLMLGKGFECEYRILRPDGTCRWIWDRRFPIKNETGQVYRLAGVAEDITERKQAQEVRAHLLERLMTVQEEERRRISRELHDETEQTLASVLVGLRAMEEVETVEAMRRSAGTLRHITTVALDELQRLVQGLRPALLDELGLAAALGRLGKEFEETHRIRVQLHVGNLPESGLSSLIEITLYRIVQEALTNIAKHAGATTVSVLVQPAVSSIRLVVEDDGSGFEPETVRRSAALEGRLGLCGMEERTKIAGGVFTIESAQGCGTMIQVEIPLSPGVLP